MYNYEKLWDMYQSYLEDFELQKDKGELPEWEKPQSFDDYCCEYSDYYNDYMR